MSLKNRIEKSLGTALPEATVGIGIYQPVKKHGDCLWVSGQLPRKEGRILFPGQLGSGVSVEQGARAARCCAEHILSQALYAAPEAENFELLRLTVFIASVDGFEDHAKVADGAAELFAIALGKPDGLGSRCALGVATLPLGSCVEVDAVIVHGDTACSLRSRK